MTALWIRNVPLMFEGWPNRAYISLTPGGVGNVEGFLVSAFHAGSRSDAVSSADVGSVPWAAAGTPLAIVARIAMPSASGPIRNILSPCGARTWAYRRARNGLAGRPAAGALSSYPARHIACEAAFSERRTQSTGSDTIGGSNRAR